MESNFEKSFAGIGAQLMYIRVSSGTLLAELHESEKLALEMNTKSLTINSNAREL
jgi:hypothetical protein